MTTHLARIDYEGLGRLTPERASLHRAFVPARRGVAGTKGTVPDHTQPPLSLHRGRKLRVPTGEGGYEGLTLILGQPRSAEAESSWVVIVPSERVPRLPGPMETPAE